MLLIYQLRHKKTGVKSFENLNSGKVPEPVLNSHTFLNDLAELATMNEFLESTNLGRDFKRKYQRNYTDQESKKRPLSVIWQEAGLEFHIPPKQ